MDKKSIRNKIIEDYSRIIEMIPVGTTAIHIKASEGFDIEGLLEDLTEKYDVIITYIIFESYQIRIYIE